MSKRTKKEEIQGQYFRWPISPRKGTFYADGRSNKLSLGRYSLSTNSHDEALRNLRLLDLTKAIEHGLAERSLLDASRAAELTVLEGWELYLESVKSRRVLQGSRNTSTYQRYCSIRDKFLRFCSSRGVTCCTQITKRLLKSYAAWLVEGGKAYATQYIEITTIKQMLKFLVDEDVLPRTALVKLKMTKPKADESDTYCYTPTEIAAMLAHCLAVESLHWLHPVLATLAYTGMRISELASLRWTDVNIERNTIVLTDDRRSAARKKSGEYRELKNGRSRSFPIHVELLPILHAIPRSSDGIVFHTACGRRLKANFVRRSLVLDVLTPLQSKFPTPPGAARGFVDGRLHSFRHAFCSLCANSGVNQHALMTWLGHSSNDMIRRYYHLHDEASQRAMAQVAILPPNAGNVT